MRNNIICLLLILFPIGLLAQPNYEIYAIKFGERVGKQPISDVAVGAKGNDSVKTCFMFWLIKGEKKNILVDAGFADDQEINPKYFVYTRPDTMLKKLNIKPEDISDIILTHPHWDHIGGISLFPNAMIWMQKEDYDYFVDDAWQAGGTKKGFNADDVMKIVERNLMKQVTLVKGDDKEIFPGIRVFTGSKHTFQSQYVLVNTGDEKVIIASDNSWYYYNLTSLLPIPITMDADAYVKNLKRMKSMVSNTDLIIPGHDPLVFTKFPSVAADIVRIK